jgi:predicted Fe-Mo cluster-binding NifX family protein
MIIVITANGPDLDAPASPVFGRCPAYVFVDTESMQFEGVENPAIGASSGAGIQAAQFVVERGAQAVVTGNVGPNAFSVFQSAGVPIYLSGNGTVREMAEAFRTGQLQSIADANVGAGMGMGGGRGRGMGMGRGMGRGMGMGMGRGMGMGMGRGMGMGTGRQAGGAFSPTPPPPPTGGAGPSPSRDEEIASLKNMAGELRQQLADVMERLDRLEK